METAVKPPSARKARGRQEMGAREFQQLPVQDRVYKSVKLWSLYLDLEVTYSSLLPSLPLKTSRLAAGKCWNLRNSKGRLRCLHGAQGCHSSDCPQLC